MNEETKVSGNLYHQPSTLPYAHDGWYYVKSVGITTETTIPLYNDAVTLLNPADLIAMAKHLKKLRGGK